MNKKDCNIIMDLLPNFIENLTNDETNNYIKEHLNECTECKSIYENMRKELDMNNKKIDKREVKYFKKFNNKLKVLKSLLIIIVVLFLGNFGYKFAVVKNMQSKIQLYKEIGNYKLIKSSYKGDTIDFCNIYHKDGKYLIKIKSINENRNYELISSSDGNSYINSDGDKVAIIGGFPLHAEEKVYNYLENESIINLIYSVFKSHISTVKYNDIECYKIDGFQSPDVLYSPYGFCIYIDKSTGLLVRVEQGIPIGDKIFTSVDDYSYEFNSVTDNDLKEPDSSGYKVENKNSK